MSNKPRKMNIRARSIQTDVDALIAQAGAPSPPLPVKPGDSTTGSQEKRISERPQMNVDVSPDVQPPWMAADKRIRKTVLLYLTEREKLMLDYIRERTSVPSQRYLAKVFLPAVEKDAERLWKNRDNEDSN